MRRNALPAARLALLGLVWICAGCVNRLAPLPVDGPVTLAPDEGIVLFFVESDEHVASIEIGSRERLEDITPGKQVLTFIAPAGVYRWRRVNPSFRAGPYFLLDRDATFRFEVRPGHLSYPGHLVLAREGNVLFTRLLNRSTEVFEHLAAEAPRLLRRYPVSFTGHTRDDFLSDYQAIWLTEGQPAEADVEPSPKKRSE